MQYAQSKLGEQKWEKEMKGISKRFVFGCYRCHTSVKIYDIKCYFVIRNLDSNHCNILFWPGVDN